MKDCRACRHEAFYYRELFSAKEQLKPEAPRSDFNERLLAEIRLREARAAWPQPNRAPRPKRRLAWILAPTVFATTALAGFMIARPPATTVDLAPPLAQAPLNESGAISSESALSAGPAARLPETVPPRYTYSAGRVSASDPDVRMLFRMPITTVSNVRHNPFSAVIATSPSHGFGQAPREQTRYVLPVVNHASARDRIF